MELNIEGNPRLFLTKEEAINLAMLLLESVNTASRTPWKWGTNETSVVVTEGKDEKSARLILIVED